MIDDAPDIVRVIRYMLRDAGYVVLYAYNGADGIEKAKTEKPDLVVTDLAMPDVSGLDVIEALHSDPETRGIPILVITAHTWEDIGQAAHRLGCDGHMSKPFTSTQLLSQIRRCLERVSEEPADALRSGAPGLRLRLS